MKKLFYTFFCIAAISGVVFYAVSMPHEPVARAVGGVLDLRGAAFEGKTYRLGGEWEFYWGRLYGPADFNAPQEKAFIPVPSSWNSHGYPRTGYATYRLRILAPENAHIMLYVPEILSAGAVWINGEKVFSAGRLGTDRDSFVSYAKSDLVTAAAESGVFEIIVQAANYEKVNGGLRHAFKIGLGEAGNPLPRSLLRRGCLLAALMGAFVVIGLYQLAFSFQRERHGASPIYLIFALSCLLLALRLFTDQDSLAQFFIRSSFFNTRLNEIHLTLSALYICLITLFSLFAFELKPGRAMRLAFAAMFILPAIAALALPAPLSRAALVLYWLPLIAVSMLAVRSLTLVKIRERPYLLFYGITLISIIVWGFVLNIHGIAYSFVGFTLHTSFLTLAQFTMLSREYTEARRRARELAAANALLKELTANISHDLRTPLTVMSAHIEEMADLARAIGHEELIRRADAAWRKNLDLARITRNLFEVSRIETGRNLYRPQWVSLAELLAQVVDKYAEYLKGQGLFLKTAYDREAELWLDGQKIWSVFDNIIYNAARHTDSGGISVTAESGGDWATVSIRDTGCGIEPQHLPHIFERFYKTDASRGGTAGDSGLGLYIVRSVMESLGGSAAAESEPGRGTAIILRFKKRG